MGFLSAAQIDALKGTITRGLETARDFYDVTVQFRRLNSTTGKYEAYGPAAVELISISFGLREVRTTTGTPVAIRSSDGDMKLWASGFIPEVGDRFTYEGETVEVSAIYPPQFGFVIAEVKLRQ